MTPTKILASAVLAAGMTVGGGALFDHAWAKSVEDLTANGFVVVKATSVQGDFDGCERGRKVPLAGGGVFTCSSFGYMHAHNPKAVLLKGRDGKFKLVVQDAVYDGAFT